MITDAHVSILFCKPVNITGHPELEKPIRACKLWIFTGLVYTVLTCDIHWFAKDNACVHGHMHESSPFHQTKFTFIKSQYIYILKLTVHFIVILVLVLFAGCGGVGVAGGAQGVSILASGEKSPL